MPRTPLWRAVFTPAEAVARLDPDAVEARARPAPDHTHDTADPAAAPLDVAQTPSTGPDQPSAARPAAGPDGPEAGRQDDRSDEPEAGDAAAQAVDEPAPDTATETPHHRRRSVTTAGPAAPVPGPGPPPGRSRATGPNGTYRDLPRAGRSLRGAARRDPGRTAGRTAAVPASARGRRPPQTGPNTTPLPIVAESAGRGTTAHGTTAHGTTGRQETAPIRATRCPSASTIASSLRPRRAVSGRPDRRRRPVRRERARDLRAGRSAAVAAAARGGPARSGRPDRDHTDLRRDRVRLVRLGPPGPGGLGAGRATRRRPAPGERAGPAATARAARRSGASGPAAPAPAAAPSPATDPAGALLRDHRGRGMASRERRGRRASGRADGGRPAEATPACPPRPGQCRICGAGRAGLADAQRRERPRSAGQLPARSTAGPEIGSAATPALRFRPESPGDDTAGSGTASTTRNPDDRAHGSGPHRTGGQQPARCSKEGA